MLVKKLSLVLALSLTITACGIPMDKGKDPVDPNSPILQIRSEGGFAPVEGILSRGPTYTLLADGRLIMAGPVIDIYPGPLLPNYQVGQISDDEMRAILDLVDEMDMASIVDEYDDSATDHVADATTEVVTYWDSAGPHVYSAYALGIDLSPSKPKTVTFASLVTAIDEAASRTETASYAPNKIRVVAGTSMLVTDPLFADVRPWPLEDDLESWTELPNGWLCTTLGPEKLQLFADATQVTEWFHPNPIMDVPPFVLLVRPLLPGETDCPI